ncbi:ferredoxin--NADP reductase [Saccharomonospora halophila]|uniref:ferredoxin--NADP reductase n=1 Tax=Saccharomonospora halophila TaxID=129922 RepID=UPI0006855417|nr:ferredoxin--NADP reductase [Saccharomonospora halophila]
MTAPPVLTLRVVEVVAETADAHSLVLEPVDDTGETGTLHYRPGQFLTVRIPGDRPGGAARCYSLCSSPVVDDKPRITVKRVEGGYGSHRLCDRAVEGTTLEALRPAGTFTPSGFDEDLLLVAGGSGSTPVLSILKSVLHAGTGAVTLVYANRDEHSVIFRDELRGLVEAFPGRLTVLHWLESVQGRPTAPAVREVLRPYADRAVFLCGPEAFMAAVTDALSGPEGLGVDRARIHVETFHSLTGDPFAAPEVPTDPAETGATADAADSGDAAATAEVILDGQRHTVRWPTSARLLDVLLAAGIDAPYSCREGNCSACACLLRDGEVSMDHNAVLDSGDLDDGLILACQARPESEHVTVTYEE